MQDSTATSTAEYSAAPAYYKMTCRIIPSAAQ